MRALVKLTAFATVAFGLSASLVIAQSPPSSSGLAKPPAPLTAPLLRPETNPNFQTKPLGQPQQNYRVRVKSIGELTPEGWAGNVEPMTKGKQRSSVVKTKKQPGVDRPGAGFAGEANADPANARPQEAARTIPDPIPISD